MSVSLEKGSVSLFTHLFKYIEKRSNVFEVKLMDNNARFSFHSYSC